VRCGKKSEPTDDPKEKERHQFLRPPVAGEKKAEPHYCGFRQSRKKGRAVRGRAFYSCRDSQTLLNLPAANEKEESPDLKKENFPSTLSANDREELKPYILPKPFGKRGGEERNRAGE